MCVRLHSRAPAARAGAALQSPRPCGSTSPSGSQGACSPHPSYRWPFTQAPRPADEEEDTVAMLMRKQEELQQMRSAISELKGLQTNVQMLLCGGQPAAAPAAEAVESEEDVLRGLLAKRAELQKMQEALASIQGFTGSQYSAQQLPTMEEEEETEEQEEEEGDEQEEDLMEELMRKHAELQRMRSTIFGSGLLDSEQGGASAPRFAPKRAWEEEEQEEEQEEQEEEEEEDDEPTTEEGWVRKLMQQQEQLKQLRAGISAVQNQVEEEEEDEVRRWPSGGSPLRRVWRWRRLPNSCESSDRVLLAASASLPHIESEFGRRAAQAPRPPPPLLRSRRRRLGSARC